MPEYNVDANPIPRTNWYWEELIAHKTVNSRDLELAQLAFSNSGNGVRSIIGTSRTLDNQIEDNKLHIQAEGMCATGEAFKFYRSVDIDPLFKYAVLIYPKDFTQSTIVDPLGNVVPRVIIRQVFLVVEPIEPSIYPSEKALIENLRVQYPAMVYLGVWESKDFNFEGTAFKNFQLRYSASANQVYEVGGSYASPVFRGVRFLQDTFEKFLAQNSSQESTVWYTHSSCSMTKSAQLAIVQGWEATAQSKSYFAPLRSVGELFTKNFPEETFNEKIRNGQVLDAKKYPEWTAQCVKYGNLYGGDGLTTIGVPSVEDMVPSFYVPGKSDGSKSVIYGTTKKVMHIPPIQSPHNPHTHIYVVRSYHEIASRAQNNSGFWRNDTTTPTSATASVPNIAAPKNEWYKSAGITDIDFDLVNDLRSWQSGEVPFIYLR